MKKTSIIVLLALCNLTSFAFSQELKQPELGGRWKYGYEDYGEFIYVINNNFSSYLNFNPNGRIIVRLCSRNKISAALIESPGFALNYLRNTKTFNIPEDKVFFATSSKCKMRTDEYWFVPENASLDYDEIVLARKVKFKGFIEEYDEKRQSRLARKEFADNTKKFIEELQNNPKVEGFIIRNRTTKNQYLQQALRQIQKHRIDKTRYKVIRQMFYRSGFPEFMFVSIEG